jgi:hypothetical protein
VEIDPTELIRDYLVGIDDSDLTPKTREFIIMGEDDEKFPESLEEAKRKMKETKSHELDLKKRKQTRAEASNHMVTYVSSDSNNSSSSEGHSSQPGNPKKKFKKGGQEEFKDANGDLCIPADVLTNMKCTYCEKTGHLAQYCFKLIRDKQNNKLDNPNVKQEKPKEVEPKAESKKKLSKLRRNAQKKAEKEKKQLSANLAHMEYAYSLPAVSHNEVFNALSKETKEKFRKNVILDNGANVNITNNIKFLRDV